MLKLSQLRQIATDIHAFAPQGLRKPVRAILTNEIGQAKSQSANAMLQESFAELAASKTKAKIFETTKKHDLEVSQLIEAHIENTFNKEKINVVRNTLKKLKIKVEDRTNGQVGIDTKFNVLQGLSTVKEAGLKLPKRIIFKPFENMRGFFSPLNPKTLFLNPYMENLYTTAIHESTHLNDKTIQLTPLATIKRLMGKISNTPIEQNKKLIEDEIREYATVNRAEFIACTAQKLLSENLGWGDLNPKIKEIYEIVKGPKFKTNQS